MFERNEMVNVEEQHVTTINRKKFNFPKAFVSICLVVAVGAMSYGVGIGVGQSMGRAQAVSETGESVQDKVYLTDKTLSNDEPYSAQENLEALEEYLASREIQTADEAFGGQSGSTSDKIFDTGETEANSETFAANDTSDSSLSFSQAAYSGAYDSVAAVVEASSDAVVSINVTSQARSYYTARVMEQTSAGSGFIIHQDNEKIYIATNNHVIDGATKVAISVDDSKQAEAAYVGSDMRTDLAVISVTLAELKSKGIDSYKIAKLGDSSKLRVGDTVVAIGNALGEGKSATSGIVSAKDKKVVIDGISLTVIQTDAAINPGNSGGALVNSSGQVIGINTAKLSSSGIEGMGYSIPINEAKIIIEELISKGYISRPYLGIQGLTVTEDIKEMYGLPTTGVYISGVYQNSSASKAGIKVSDIIVKFGDQRINSIEELTAAINKTKVNDKVNVEIARPSGNITVVVTMSDQNNNQ